MAKQTPAPNLNKAKRSLDASQRSWQRKTAKTVKPADWMRFYQRSVDRDGGSSQ